MTTNNVSANRSYPLPYSTNLLDEDVTRLISAINAIDTDVAAALAGLLTKSSTGHGHVINDVAGLQSALDSKADADGEVSLASLSDVDVAGAAAGMFLRLIGTKWSPAAFDASMVASGVFSASRLPSHLTAAALSAAYAALVHSHAIADVVGLQGALDGKAAASHVHAISAITDLQAQLDARARTDTAINWLQKQTFSGGIHPGFVIKKQGTGGSEGGEMRFERGDLSALNGNVVVDLANDQMRFFEGLSPFRGAYLNLLNMASNVGARILTTLDGGGGMTLLGTIQTPDGAGSMVTLSNLDLSSYDFVVLEVAEVDPTGSTQNAATLAVGGYFVGNGVNPIIRQVWINLNTGFGMGNSGNSDSSSLSKFSTSITATTTSSFKGGNIYVWGIK